MQNKLYSLLPIGTTVTILGLNFRGKSIEENLGKFTQNISFPCQVKIIGYPKNNSLKEIVRLSNGKKVNLYYLDYKEN